MVYINLRTNWFGPDGNLYKSSRNPHNFPDSWKAKLPKSAAEVSGPDEDEEEEVKAPAKK